MTIKTFERTNPDAKNFTKFPSSRKFVSDLFSDTMFELVDYVDESVTYVFNILDYTINIAMDFKTAGEHRAEIISALKNRHYQGLIVWLDDYVTYHGNTFCCAIHKAYPRKFTSAIHYETVEEVQEALRLLFIALQDADLPL